MLSFGEQKVLELPLAQDQSALRDSCTIPV